MALSSANIKSLQDYWLSAYQIQQIQDAYSKNPSWQEWINLANTFKKSIDDFKKTNQDFINKPTTSPTAGTGTTTTTNNPVSWQISSWKSTWNKWDTQPVMTIGWKTYKFDTPQEYINKLKELKSQGNTWPIDQFISEFQWAINNWFIWTNSTDKDPWIPTITNTPTTGTTAWDYGTIINNLNEGMKNSPTSFKDQAAYKKAYGYDTATPEKKLILDTFWWAYEKWTISASNPFSYSQSWLEELVKKMPDLLAKQKENNPDVQVNFDPTEYTTNFDTGWDAYTKANVEAYWKETELWTAKYTNAQQDYDTSITRTREDYNKWTTRNQYDFARNISQYDKSFATQLSQAQNAYGQRGMLNSWLAKKAQQQAVITANEEKGYNALVNQRNVQDASTSMNRANADYSTNTGRLATEKANYLDTRKSWLTVLQAGLKQTWNNLYNQGLIQQWQTLYDTAKQKSLDQLYGRTTTTYSLPLR